MISNKYFEDHIKKLDKVINCLKQKGFIVNAEKSFSARNELEYLGFGKSRQGVMLFPDKVEVIKNIAVLTKKTIKRLFISN